MVNVKKEVWVRVLLTAVFVGWSFIGERYFFDFKNINADGIDRYVLAKILLSISVYAGIGKGIDIVKRYIEKDRQVCRMFNTFLVVFLAYVIILMIVWPGIWYGDDMLVLKGATTFDVIWIQGLTISLWDMIAMMLIPIPSFLVLIHIFILSVSASIASEIAAVILGGGGYMSGRAESKWRYLMLIPFFLPATIYYTIFTHRSSTAALLELFCFVWLIYCWKCNSNPRIRLRTVIFAGILFGILPGLRNETLIIMAMFLLMWYYIFWKKTGIIQKAAIGIVSFGVVIAVNFMTGNNRSQYDMAYMLNPLPMLLTSDHLRSPNLEEDLSAIDQVLDLAKMRSYKPSYVHNWCWDDNPYRPEYTQEDFNNLKKAFWDLIRYNPQIYFKARIHTFLSATSLDSEKGINFLLKPHHEFMKQKDQHGLGELPAFTPIFPGVRLAALDILTYEGLGLWRIFYNFIPSLAVLFITFVYGISRRKFMWFVIGGGNLSLAAAIFLLSPEANIMYYLPVYYMGLIVGIYWLLLSARRRQLNKQRPQ